MTSKPRLLDPTPSSTHLEFIAFVFFTLWRSVQCEPKFDPVRMALLHLLQLLPQEDVLLHLMGGGQRVQITTVLNYYYYNHYITDASSDLVGKYQ